MIFSPILNFSELNKHSATVRRSGTGTVMLDPDTQTISIKSGSELITAKYEGNELHSGDSIRYTLFNDILLIEKKTVKEQTDRLDYFIKQQPTDLNRITHQINSLLTVISNPVLSDKIRQDAFSILNSLAGLSAKIDPSLIQEINLILQTNGELNLDSTEKLKNLFLQIKQAILTPLMSKFIELPTQSIPGDIYKFEMFEDLLKSLHLSKTIFSQTGTSAKAFDCQYIRIFPCGNKTIAAMISTDELQQELKTLIGSFVSPPMRSVPVSTLQSIIENRNQLNLQLLNTIDVLMSNLPNVFFAKRTGSESIQNSTITHWLLTSIDHQSILPELVNLYPSTATSILSSIEEKSSFFPASENFGITEKLLSNIKRKEDLIPIIIEKLGFNFDRKLCEPGFALRERTSLKALILGKIYDSEINAALPSISSITNIPKYPMQLLDNVCTELFIILEKLSGCNQSGLETKRIVQSLSDSLFQIDNIRKNYSLSDFQTIGVDKEYENGFKESLNDKLINLLFDLTNNIRSLQNTFQTAGENSSSVLYDYLFKFDQKLNKLIEYYTIDNSDFRNADGFDPQSNVLLRDKNENDTLSKTVSNWGTMLKDSTISDQLSKPFLDSLLNRIESLQLLSRSISTADGAQQVLALPMNFDGEWTEINIRLLKKNSSKKKVQKNFYKVEINVSPSKLGAISVQMEYELKKRFNLKISFDKNQTLEWFSKNRTSFGRSLINLGLPLVDFHLQSEIRKCCETESTRLSNTVFDIKI